jgi:hypothetical protein
MCARRLRSRVLPAGVAAVDLCRPLGTGSAEGPGQNTKWHVAVGAGGVANSFATLQGQDKHIAAEAANASLV